MAVKRRGASSSVISIGHIPNINDALFAASVKSLIVRIPIHELTRYVRSKREAGAYVNPSCEEVRRARCDVRGARFEARGRFGRGEAPMLPDRRFPQAVHNEGRETASTLPCLAPGAAAGATAPDVVERFQAPYVILSPSWPNPCSSADDTGSRPAVGSSREEISATRGRYSIRVAEVLRD
jgi:hypothetical protein